MEGPNPTFGAKVARIVSCGPMDFGTSDTRTFCGQYSSPQAMAISVAGIKLSAWNSYCMEGPNPTFGANVAVKTKVNGCCPVCCAASENGHASATIAIKAIMHVSFEANKNCLLMFDATFLFTSGVFIVFFLSRGALALDFPSPTVPSSRISRRGGALRL